MTSTKHEITCTVERFPSGGWGATAAVDGQPKLFSPSSLATEAAAAADGALMVRRLRVEYGLDPAPVTAYDRMMAEARGEERGGEIVDDGTVEP